MLNYCKNHSTPEKSVKVTTPTPNKDHWQEKEINLEKLCSIFLLYSFVPSLFIYSKPNVGDKSLGFTIAGGIDKPFVNPHFTSIIITNITENSLAHRDKRLK